MRFARHRALLLALVSHGLACGSAGSVALPGDDAGAPGQDAGAPDAAPRDDVRSVAARLLLVSADGGERALLAVRRALELQGTPYTLWIAGQAPGQLTAEALADGVHGRYQGVILARGEGPLAEPERQALRAYEAAFGVRRAVLFGTPAAEDGFAVPAVKDTSRVPIAAALTPAGEAAFPYLEGRLTIERVDAYLAAAAGDGATPLLVDGAGHALIAVTTHADGRETMMLTFDGDPARVHSIALSYGVVSWVARGLFIGERRVVASPQVDDVFLPNALASGERYRISGDDLRAVAAWQRALRRRPFTAAFAVTLVFNGKGATGLYAPDTLTPAARELQGEFLWVNHTFAHQDLDEVDAALTETELARNDELARQLGLSSYSAVNLVTPGYSGLANPAAMRAARDHGIRFVVSDTSIAGNDNPFPNVGIPNAVQPEVLELPRHSAGIHVDATTPDEQTAVFNARYPELGGLTYAQIIERSSDRLLGYLLLGDLDPWMFHQSNLRAYDGARSLLGDAVERAFDKYEAIYRLPILAPTMDELGARVAERTELWRGGVSGTIVPGERLTLSAEADVTVPVTGLRAADAEEYGGEPTARVRVTAGSPVTVPLR